MLSVLPTWSGLVIATSRDETDDVVAGRERSTAQLQQRAHCLALELQAQVPHIDAHVRREIAEENLVAFENVGVRAL